jgi:hypothetical protein
MKIGKIILIFIVLLWSCDDDEPQAIKRGTMSADISGVHNFRFETDKILVNIVRDSVLRSITASGNTKIGDTLFILTTSINKDTNLIGDTFQREYPRVNRRVYESFSYGIDEEYITYTDTSMIIPFEFEALFGTLVGGSIKYDTVFVRNGIINYLR